MGNRCYAVRRDKQIASAKWVITDNVWVDLLSRELLLRKGEIYLYDAYTHPSYRGQGLSGSITAGFLKRYQAAGYQYACSIVALENRSQIRSSTRSRFKRTTMECRYQNRSISLGFIQKSLNQFFIILISYVTSGI